MRKKSDVGAKIGNLLIEFILTRQQAEQKSKKKAQAVAPAGAEKKNGQDAN